MSDTLSGDETLMLPEFDAPPAEPLGLAREWLDRAVERGVSEPWVGALATVGTVSPGSGAAGSHPVPSVRMVLVKAVDDSGLVFSTYVSSRKGRELAANPAASLVFYWRETVQQLKVEGVVERLDDAESDLLFAERSRSARATTAVSHQGSPLQSEELLAAAAKRLLDSGDEIARPADWAGYRLVPTAIEFWHGRTDRLHRRLAYLRGVDGSWRAERLQP